jgi:hypothetical protein
VPTTLPRRRTASRDQSVPLHVQVGVVTILLLAIFVALSILDRAGLSFAPDGDGLVALSEDSQWSLPIGFAP